MDAQSICSLRWWHQAMYQLDISEAYSSGTLKRNMFFFPIKNGEQSTRIKPGCLGFLYRGLYIAIISTHQIYIGYYFISQSKDPYEPTVGTTAGCLRSPIPWRHLVLPHVCSKMFRRRWLGGGLGDGLGRKTWMNCIYLYRLWPGTLLVSSWFYSSDILYHILSWCIVLYHILSYGIHTGIH